MVATSWSFYEIEYIIKWPAHYRGSMDELKIKFDGNGLIITHLQLGK